MTVKKEKNDRTEEEKKIRIRLQENNNKRAEENYEDTMS